jgi:hypothetical protein
MEDMEKKMVNIIRIALSPVFCLLLFYGGAIAQSEQGGSRLEIISKPPGATVVLSGEVDLAAVAPCVIQQDIVGNVKVKATRPGYENWKANIILLPNQQYTLNIRMKRMTRFKAAARSMLIPGWGQYYSGNRFKGVLMGLSSIAGVTAAWIADDNYNRKYDDFKDAEDDYRAAASIEESLRLKDLMNDKRRKAYDAETTRNTFLGIAVGIWAYNVLDAIVFFPDYRQDYLNRSYPTLQSAIINGAPGLVLTAEF